MEKLVQELLQQEQQQQQQQQQLALEEAVHETTSAPASVKALIDYEGAAHTNSASSRPARAMKGKRKGKKRKARESKPGGVHGDIS